MGDAARPGVPSIARRVADELADGGAEAVVLVGSHARGDAGPDSDLDLLAVGSGAYDCRLERRGGLLVSVSVQPVAEYERDLALPERVCAAVPGWREAAVLHDPGGIAASLIRKAREWSWEPLERRCDGWTAEKVTGYAEEVHKLVTALEDGRRSTAAVQRSLLAIHLAPILAVHRRILYGSENRLWDLLVEAMGGEWGRAQSAALGLSGEGFEETCAAALRLYGLAASEVAALLDDRQRGVVRHALALSAPVTGAQSASL